MQSAKGNERFRTLLDRAKMEARPVILDGAVGTELDSRGGDTGAPLWSGMAPLKNPDMLKKIHSEYVSAGAEIITTSTFRTTEHAFAKAHMPPGDWERAARKAVVIAKRVAGNKALVGGSVAPLEDCFSPELAPMGREAKMAHQGLCQLLSDLEVDILWLETFGVLGELEAAIDAAKEAGSKKGIPFVVGVTTKADGNLVSGESIQLAFQLASTSGALAFNINCVPPSYVDTALNALTPQNGCPIGVYANLGFPEEKQDWRGSAYVDPPAYAAMAKRWAEANVSLVGGCCGSTPSHIEKLQRQFKRAEMFTKK